MRAPCVFLGLLLLSYQHCARGRAASPRAQTWRAPANVTQTLVIPRRASPAGEPYQDGQNFINYTSTESASYPDRLFYKLSAFGKTFLLDLRQDSGFISPTLTVEHVYSEKHRIPYSGHLQHCFYRGQVNQDPVSSAVLNVCNGLRGVFSTGDEKYFIEPAEPRAENLDNDRKFHLLYRHLTAQDRVVNDKMMCGLRGTTANPLDSLPNIQHGRSRRKRALEEAFVETMVTVDRTMVAAFESRADLQSYIITLMGMVAQTFRDSSIGFRLNIVLVKIIILEYDEPDLKITSSATKTLKKFCKWQLKKGVPDDSNPDHYDTAMLLTKTDICRLPGRCDTLGLAELGTMCTPHRSCTVVEDTGLNTAFTIAHELGHIIGLPHDGDRNECNRRSGKQRLMSPSLSLDGKPWTWSECSREYILKFMEHGNNACLRDSPAESRVTAWQDVLPGELYSPQQQCEMAFGKETRACERMEECSRLWCTRRHGSRMACSTQHMPWSDGTPCGKDKQKWCIRGRCVEKQRLKPVDGGWSPWQPYKECTRTCGGGVMFAERECNKPTPLNGGNYCRGERKRFRSCNAEACPEDGAPFRDVQCSRLDEKVVKIKGVPTKLKWTPLYKVDKNKQCKLTCRAVGKSYYFTLDNVVDGTPCTEDGTDICVGGKCLPAGCDRVLGSDARLDECGVCNGDNSTCTRKIGTVSKPVEWGYNHVLTLPVGASNVRITQVAPTPSSDGNYLALKVQGGKYLLNGGLVITFGLRKFREAGMKMWYSGSSAPNEEIRMTGKTTEALKVYVLSVSLQTPLVRYSYLVPVTRRVPYVWGKTAKWTDCTLLCHGKRRRLAQCVRATDERPVPNHRCDPNTKPFAIVEDCNTSCELRWQVTPEHECSARCGPGKQTRRVLCMRVGSRQWDHVLDKHCSHMTKPSTEVDCVGACANSQWTYSDWSECSKSCGTGTQTREATCYGDRGELLNDTDCRESDREPIRRQCNTAQCPGWRASEWGQCTVSCGEGTQSRDLQCVADGLRLPQGSCDAHAKPDATRPCVLAACPNWRVGEWSECSVSCGEGVKERSVECDGDGCDENAKPAAVGACEQPSCPEWSAEPWTECSVSCGEGGQSRAVKCVTKDERELPEGSCDPGAKPAGVKRCVLDECPRWRAGSWSRCSVSCGEGVQRRSVTCVSSNSDEARSSSCDDRSKPTGVRRCVLDDCPSWQHGDWSECSVSCGAGTRTREVRCVTDEAGTEVLTPEHCDASSRPQESDSCAQPECPAAVPDMRTHWESAEWSECSASCGEGNQSRVVSCFSENGKRVANAECTSALKPPSNQKCVKRSCTSWKYGAWSACSRTCGLGFRIRVVKCAYDNWEITDDSHCDSREKPDSRLVCRIQTCYTPALETRPTSNPTTARPPQWSTGKWNQCSVSCGAGIKRRVVLCSTKDGTTSNLCDPGAEPAASTPCNEGPCPVWTVTSWGECTVTCGRGLQSRRVTCDGVDCDVRTRPLATRLCNAGPCPQWTSGAWSECSRTCGQGEMTREVSCTSGSGRNLDESACAAQAKPPQRQACSRADCVPGAAWKKGAWTKCSVYCGEGTKTRPVWCYAQGRKVDEKHCSSVSKPRTLRPCNKRQRCGQWEMGPWSKCSKTCGEGEQTRAIRCLNVDEYKRPETKYCDLATRPADRRPCNGGSCGLTPHRYQWQTAAWSKCSKKCGYGRKSRLMRCINQRGNPVSEDHCDDHTRPSKFIRCFNMQCPPRWSHGDWSQCSKTCGRGFQFRQVQCDGAPTTDQSAAASCDRSSKPPVWRHCILGACGGEHRWRTGSWSQCSVTCGEGYMRRAVSCVDKEGRIVRDSSCASQESPKPDETGSCQSQPCAPGSCRDVQLGSSLYDDGEHILQVQGKPLKVYCHGMMTSTPREYITLKAGSSQNFAEVYPKRLRNPQTCPMNGSQTDTCNCEDREYERAGGSYFSKLRIDLGEMRIMVDDKQFAETTGNFPPSYASAGDCYSALQCPQGRFGINLEGTGLAISPRVEWRASGHSYSKMIYRYPEGRIVIGKCGGHCGMCSPHTDIGLKVVLS